MRIFTVLGPAHAGKSTLAQALADLEGGPVERFAVDGVAQALGFRFMDEPWMVVDFAGGAESLASAGPALAGSDAALICVPADPEAAVLAAPYFRLVEEAGLPAFVFVNGVDKATGRISEVVSALQAYCAHALVLRQVPIRDGDAIVGSVDLISERAWKYQEGRPSLLVELPASVAPREQDARAGLLESLADFDDHLLEQLVEDQAPPATEVYGVAARSLQHGDVHPVFIGSALHRNGIQRMMKSLRHEAPGAEVAHGRLSQDGRAVAVPLLADLVRHLGKVVLLRALGGTVSGGDTLGSAAVGSVTALDARTGLSGIGDGAAALAVKTDHLAMGRVYSGSGDAPLPDWAEAHPANHRRIILPGQDRDEARLSAAVERMSQVDPGFTAMQDERTGHVVFCTQGPLHLRRLLAKLSDGLGIEATDRPVPVALCETLSRPVERHHRHRKQSGGAGQFADVLIALRPEPRGFGFAFHDEVKGGAVPRNYIPSVEAGIRDALTEGPGGAPVIDVSAVLKDGKHHSVDSSDFAFRTVGRAAAREAMEEAGMITLQPIAVVQIHIPSVMAGSLVPLVTSLKGQVRGFAGHPTATGWDVFDCLMPMAGLDDLYQSLGGAGRGTAWFTATFDHFEELRADAAAALGRSLAEKA